MTRKVQVSSTYQLTVEHSTFANCAPCIAFVMHFMGGFEPVERGRLGFSMRAIPEVLEALVVVDRDADQLPTGSHGGAGVERDRGRRLRRD